MEIIIGFVIVWILGSVMLSLICYNEYSQDYPLEFLWWPIWLITVGLMRILKNIKRAISEEWNK